MGIVDVFSFVNLRIFIIIFPRRRRKIINSWFLTKEIILIKMDSFYCMLVIINNSDFRKMACRRITLYCNFYTIRICSINIGISIC